MKLYNALVKKSELGKIEDIIMIKEGFSWTASFDSLTNEGKKLYYSLRKLHNNKEVRILTFNNVD